MTDAWTEPRDEHTERTLAGLFLTGTVPADVAKLVQPADWWMPSLRVIVEACFDMTAKDKPCDPITVRTELLRRGERGQAVDAVWLLDLVQAGCVRESGTFHARTLRDLAVRREVLRAARRTMQSALDPGCDPYETAASFSVQTAVLVERDEPGAPSSAVDSGAFCEGSLDYDWLVPGLLERGDRLLITGGEGGGKSVLVRQLAVSIAAGVHPFDGSRFDPKRTLMVDLENGERTLRRHLIGLRAHAARINAPVPTGGLMVESVPAGVDLTRPEGESWLNRLTDDVRPDLLVIGPLYRMHAADMAKEEPARQLTHVVDLVRARHGCTVVMETHAPHANATTGKRSLRPVGSSLFMRWPEFGYGLSPSETSGVTDLVPWRGPRDERTWPAHLQRGDRASEWPWVEHNPHAHLGRHWSDPIEPEEVA